MENCRTESVTCKGLQLKLQVKVSNNDDELQYSINNLLFKVNREICDTIRDDHLRLSEEYGIPMEKCRDQLKASLTDKDMFDIDSKISDMTEKRKDDILATHEKKLKYLKCSRQSYQNKNNERVLPRPKRQRNALLKTKILNNPYNEIPPQFKRAQVKPYKGIHRQTIQPNLRSLILH